MDFNDWFFLGVEGRYHFVGDRNNDFGTIGASVGFRF